MSATEDAAFVKVPTDEYEAIVADLDGAIEGILDAMLGSETMRGEMLGTLMKVASARFLVRKQLEEHDEKHGTEGEVDHG